MSLALTLLGVHSGATIRMNSNIYCRRNFARLMISFAFDGGKRWSTATAPISKSRTES
jgi:hypothetical protein